MFLLYQDHQITIPYNAVVMIVIAKEAVKSRSDRKTTIINGYIAHILKFCPADEEAKQNVYDYRVLLNSSLVKKIDERVYDCGGIQRCYPDEELKPAADILREINAARLRVGSMRGLDRREKRVHRRADRSWTKACLMESIFQIKEDLD